MKGITKTVFLTGAMVFTLSAWSQVEQDSVMYQRDSAIMLPAEATVLFFQTGEKVADPTRVTVIDPSRKILSFATFLKAKKMASADHVLFDLDGDGKKELLILNFSPGPLVKSSSLMIDELWIYKMLANNRYQYAGKLIGGNSIISPGPAIDYNLEMFFDEFYTCSGCGYTDQSDEAPIPLKKITLTYLNGKLLLPKGDQELRSIINDNLGKLGEKAGPLPINSQDDGTHKEIAMNLAVYYYSFGKSLVATKNLFNKYYKQADAKKVWVAFTKQLQQVGGRVSF